MTKSADRSIERLAEARFLLDQEDAGSADAIAFVHTVLCQIGLPRSPQKELVWQRSNGGAHLTVLAGGVIEGGIRVQRPLPQGPYARLILADISTYAVRFKTPLIPMEASAGAYMRRRLQLVVNGGKRGTYTGFKREAQALAAAHMELSVRYGDKQFHTKSPPIEAFDAWTVDDGEQQALWPCELLLTDRFFRSLQSHAAPIDMRAYRALAQSALAQDIYTWLAHRLPRVRAPLRLPWTELADQFGGYANPKRFRLEFIQRLKEVRVVYPDARVEVVNGRRGESGGSLELRPSAPPVSRAFEVVPVAIGAPAVPKLP